MPLVPFVKVDLVCKMEFNEVLSKYFYLQHHARLILLFFLFFNFFFINLPNELTLFCYDVEQFHKGITSQRKCTQLELTI